MPAAILVRRATIADAPAFARTMSDAAVYPSVMQLPFTDAEVWRARLTETLAPGRQDLMLVAELAGEVVGNAGLHPDATTLRRRHVMRLGMAVLPPAQRRGVGSALMAALLDYADNWAQVLRIELTVYADNERAIGLYRKFCFDVEGRHRAYAMRDGVFVDAVAMARLHPRQPLLLPMPLPPA